MASLGNISENPHVGMIFIDFSESTVGPHVNGRAKFVENDELLTRADLPDEIRADLNAMGGKKPERWMLAASKPIGSGSAERVADGTLSEEGVGIGNPWGVTMDLHLQPGQVPPDQG